MPLQWEQKVNFYIDLTWFDYIQESMAFMLDESVRENFFEYFISIICMDTHRKH